MSMKFSIAKTIDMDKLWGSVSTYKKNNKENPYIFMNKDTIKAAYEESISFQRIFYAESSQFSGYKIFENNDLEFGEVEIR